MAKTQSETRIRVESGHLKTTSQVCLVSTFRTLNHMVGACALLSLCAVQPAAASTVFVAGEVDDGGSYTASAGISHLLAERVWLSAAGGRTGGDGDNRYGTLAVDLLAGDFSFGIGFDASNNRTADTRTLRGEIDFAPSQGWVNGGVFVERQDVDMRLGVAVGDRIVTRRENLDVRGLGGTAGFHTDGGIHAQLTHVAYDFPKKFDNLERRLNRFARGALTDARFDLVLRVLAVRDAFLFSTSSLIERSTYATIGKDWQVNGVSLALSHDRAALGGTSDAMTLAWRRSLDADNDLEFRVGGARIEGSGSGYLGLTWFRHF